MAYDLSDLLEYASESSGYYIPCFKDDGSVDLLATSSCGDTLLHAAVGMGAPEAVRYLVEAGLNINSRGDYLATPLYQAAASEDIGMTRLLLELGADSLIPDYRGHIPSYEFAKTGAEQAVPPKSDRAGG